MSDLPPYPSIDPTNFDLISIGTGLPESLLSAAVSSLNKSVLHLDANPFYGSHFSSLSLLDFTSFLNDPHPPITRSSSSECEDHDSVPLQTRPLYSDVEITVHSPAVLEHSRKFNLDVNGPRLLFCADVLTNLILKAGVNQYLELKGVEETFVWNGEQKLLWSVPDTRGAIFRDKMLSLVEKNLLMRFFKTVQEHLVSSSGNANGNGDDENMKISEDDLESPFIDYLSKMRLSPKIKSIILYAIAMVDYEQDSCTDMLKTREGIDRLALYHQSSGRFPNAPGAFLYPLYGIGELPQAFCRRAAVKGCLYVLRMPVTDILLDKENGQYKGVRLASGQELFSSHIVLDPSYIIPSQFSPSNPTCKGEGSLDSGLQSFKGKVARGICITSSSLKQGSSNFLVVYPPRSLYPEQVASIRILQIGDNLAVCPSNMFVLYLLALCDDATQGKKLLHEAMAALSSLLDSEKIESSSLIEDESPGEVKPSILWSALYIQEMHMGSHESIYSAPMPNGSLHNNDVLGVTTKFFQMMYPNEEFIPEITPESNEEDVHPSKSLSD